MTVFASDMTGLLGVAGAALWGLALAAGACWLTCLARRERDDLLLTEAERRRRRILRARSRTYRWFEPTVAGLAGWDRRTFPARVERLGADLELTGERDWRPEEFLAVRQIEAGQGFFAGAGLGLVLFGASVALPLGGVFYALTLLALVRGSAKRAKRHCDRLRNRLPAVIDLMALMLEAGAGTLRECLEKAEQENGDHPIGEELRRVLVRIDQGVAQADALREMGRRLNDPEVGELVFTLTTAEERGVPLKASLRDLATKMRLRQVQWMEKAAEEARVHITWPGLLVTLACLLIVVAPIVFTLAGGQ